MPRRFKSPSPRKFTKSRASIRSKPPASGHKVFFVTMTNLHDSKPYIENFYNRHKRCYYAEYYTVPHPEIGTYDIYAYIQLQYPTLIRELINYFNCRTTLKSTTIAEKLSSPFHNDCVYNKVKLGVESVSVANSLWASEYNAQNLYNNDLKIQLDSALKPAV